MWDNTEVFNDPIYYLTLYTVVLIWVFIPYQ